MTSHVHHGDLSLRHLDGLFNSIFRLAAKEIATLCLGNQLVTGGFPHKGPAIRKSFPCDDAVMNMAFYMDSTYFPSEDSLSFACYHQISKYKTHFSRQLNCWSLRCSWSIACRRCSNYIFILNLTPGFNGLGKGNYRMRREAFKFWDLVRLVLDTLRLVTYADDLPQGNNRQRNKTRLFNNLSVQRPAVRQIVGICNQAPDSIHRCHLTSIGNPIVEIGRS